MHKLDFETGVDNNFDGHCDICGRFVNNYGQHRAARIFDYVLDDQNLGYLELDKKNDSLNISNFIRTFIKGDPYNMYKNMTYNYWPFIYKYSQNNNKDPLSCRSINNFLRNDVIPNEIDVSILIERVLQIKLAINQFEVSNEFVTYRGLSFSQESNFIKMLDEAYNANKANELFVYEENGFTSTTRDLSYARFKSNSNGDKYHVLFAYIHLPGAKAMPLSKEWGTTHNDNEQEILLRCHETFYIASIQRYKINDEIYYRGIIINSKEKLK